MSEAHPLKVWLDANRVSYRQAASRCKRGGVGTSPKYIEQIAIGWCRPGTDIARYISEKLTKGAVSLESLLTWPYRRVPAKKRVA